MMAPSFYIQWHVSNRCNLRCRHCYQVDFTKKDDLGWEALRAAAENILLALRAWKGEACIHLTGGEPLLNPELFPLLEHLNRQPEVAELGLITNGLLLTPEILDRFSSFEKLKTVKISLDGAHPQVHDRIRAEGSFARAMEKIALVQERSLLEVNLMFTVMKSNLASLPGLLRLGKEMGVEGMIIERFIPLGRGKEIEDEILDKFRWRNMVKALFAYFSLDLEEEDFPPYQAFQVDFRGSEPRLLGAPCVLGTEGFCVMPNADVFPCRRFPLAIGNLLRNPLKNILESSELLNEIRSRENLKGKCRTCDRADCMGCRSLAFSVTGDPFAEDPHCWYTPPA